MSSSIPQHQSVSERGVVLDGRAKFWERYETRRDLKGRGKLPSYETPADPIMVAPMFPSYPDKALIFFRRISMDVNDPTRIFIVVPVPLLGAHERDIEEWLWRYNEPLLQACTAQKNPVVRPVWHEFGDEESGLERHTQIFRPQWRFNDPMGSLLRAFAEHFDGNDFKVRLKQLQQNQYIYQSTTASLPLEKRGVTRSA